ncbi:hypothetical protein GGR57DRAFT_290424 [Xylariaceae sp. FL1272]|nr:hypothetical protein GGR57DRAFT_290424 [Xylariaceae sp. FL1272]
MTMPIPALPDQRQFKPALEEGDSTPTKCVSRQQSAKSFYTARSKISSEQLNQLQVLVGDSKKDTPTPIKLESSSSVSELRKSFEKAPEHTEQPDNDGISGSHHRPSSLKFEHHAGPSFRSGSIHRSKLPIRSGSTVRRNLNPLVDPDQIRLVELKGEGRMSIGLPEGVKSNRASIASFSSKTQARVQDQALGQSSSPSTSVKREVSYSAFPSEFSQPSGSMLPSLDGASNERARLNHENKMTPTTPTAQENIRPTIESDPPSDRKFLGSKKFGEILNSFEQRDRCIAIHKSRAQESSKDSGADDDMSQRNPPTESAELAIDFPRTSGIPPSISMFIDTDDFIVDFSEVGTEGEHTTSLSNAEEVIKKESPVKEHIKHFERLSRGASVVAKRLSIKHPQPEQPETEPIPRVNRYKAVWRKISNSVKTSVNGWKARDSGETSVDKSDAVGGTDDPSSKVSGPSTARSGPSPFGFSLHRTKHKTQSSNGPITSPEENHKQRLSTRIVGGLTQLNGFAFGLDGHHHSRPVVDEQSTASNPATPASASPAVVDPDALQKAITKQAAEERHRRRQEGRREKTDRVRSMFKGKQKETAENSRGKEDKGKGKEKEVCNVQTQTSP